MGSIAQEEMYGTFSVPIWDPEPQSDPATRPYLAPPMPKEVQQRKFKLIDFRDQVFNAPSGGDYTLDREFMSKHGFTAVKHSSYLPTKEEFEDNEHLRSEYFAEIKDLVKQVTGCSEVVAHVSVCRGGTPPKDVKDMIALKGIEQNKEHALNIGHRKAVMQPIRIPHCDDARAGGRQFIRSGLMDMREAAKNAGVVQREDEICSAAGQDAKKRESTQILHEKYNDHAAKKLGPRYAAFSIWRPMKPVTRDPLALVSWTEVLSNEDYIAWPYDNRIQGPDGDWTKELAMMKVKPEVAAKGDVEENLKFWYVSNQKPDEVLFVKMFDSAALGNGSSEESGCLHGSPDLGDNAFGDERQSIEVRCYAFW